MTAAILPNHVTFTNNASFRTVYDLFKSNEQDKKFTIILLTLFTLYFIIAVIVPFLEQDDIPRTIKEQVPVQLARIILKEQQLPLPVKPKEKVIEAKPIEEKPKELKKEKNKDQPIKPPAVLSQKKKRVLAKQKAKISGLAAMKDELFAMRTALAVIPSSKITLNKSKTSETKIKRKLLTADMNKQSTTLNAKKTLQIVNSNKLSTRDTQQLRLSAAEVLETTDVVVEESNVVRSSGQRSEMSLRRTLEAHKSRLYARYNRALRKDPFLQGKVLFEIEIQPDGKVSQVVIKSSELNNAKLEQQLLIVLRSITFPNEGASAMITIWAIDFLPS